MDNQAPMTGVDKQINGRVNDAVCALMKDHLSDGWFI
jgi:hypothetical protein